MLDMPLPPALTLRYANTDLAQWEAAEVAADYFEVGLEAISSHLAGDEVELCRILKMTAQRGYCADLIPREDFDELLRAVKALVAAPLAKRPEAFQLAAEAIEEAEAAARLVDREWGDA